MPSFKITSLILLCLNAFLFAEKPNFIIILSDDAGHADFGFKGSKNFPTPHIDSIATNGVHFTNAYVSGAVCSPSRAGLITGRYQGRFGYENNLPPSSKSGLDPKEITFADSMKKLGYQTGIIGKWHLGYGDKYHPNKRGFDYFYGLQQGSRSYWSYEKPSRHRVIEFNGTATAETDEYMTDRLGKNAVKFISENKEKPFFLYLSFTAVHSPYQADKKDLDSLRSLKLSKSRKNLAAMTKSLDDNVGLVIHTLKKHDLYNNTILIFLNDNGGTGPAVNKPLKGKKGNLYEGGIRVPFCLQWPAAVKATQTIDQPVIALDLLPTAIAAAGGLVPTEQKIDGINLLPFIRHGKSIPARTLFWRKHTGAPTAWKALRKGRWKYHHYMGEESLFDLENDIGETQNIKDKHPEVFLQLQQEMYLWDKQMKAPLFGKGSRNQNTKEIKKLSN